jgi:hypothetical protein
MHVLERERFGVAWLGCRLRGGRAVVVRGVQVAALRLEMLEQEAVLMSIIGNSSGVPTGTASGES